MTQSGPTKTLTQSAPQTPPAPATAPGGAPPQTVTPDMLTQGDLGALRARANELSNQLNSAVGRRHSLQDQMRRASGTDKTGLEQRITQLDARILRLEGDIDENGKALASLPAQRAAIAQSPPPPLSRNDYRRNNMNQNAVPIAIVFTIFVLSPIALSVSRLFWKRGSMPRQASANPENTERLERMEQAIDSIAIEVERVSEGQRFVTRLLAEGRPPAAVRPQAAEAVPLSVGQQAGAPR